MSVRAGVRIGDDIFDARECVGLAAVRSQDVRGAGAEIDFRLCGGVAKVGSIAAVAAVQHVVAGPARQLFLDAKAVKITVAVDSLSPSVAP